ncbi:hypothetical protein C8R43DRAFT_294750 [Mycena crocata]|nr:hypothetical protein C8R43DRAFT_294750 [Mycena crocata]
MATPITSISDIPSSPTMSFASSFDMVSVRSRSSTSSSQSLDMYLDDSDDEIVWSVSEASESLSSSSSDISTESSGSPASDDDFVVLGRPRSLSLRGSDDAALPTPTSDGGTSTPNNLAADLVSLSLNQVSATIRRSKKAATPAVKLPRSGASPKQNGKPNQSQSQSPSPLPSPVSDRPSSVTTLKKGSPSGKAGRRRRKNKIPGAVAAGFGARPIVDDVSEQPDSCSERGDNEFAVPSMYEQAASYISSSLADPTSACRLTLLQALIIELGLASSALPTTLTSAKATLKSRAFLNVAEYLDARQKGPAAVQGVMHPSKTALIKDIRRKRNPTSLQWVKETGLQVLLVPCYRH